MRLAVQARDRARHGLGLDLLSVWLDRKDLDRRGARACCERCALDDKRDAAAASLPHGDQRKLEVALLMALDPKVFMFDEPTAGMSVDEVPVILDLIRALKARKRPGDPAGRAQDGRGARTGRPHHRAAQRRAGGRRRAGRGDRLAGRAAGLPGHGGGRSRHECRRAANCRACTPTSARTTSCTASTSRCRAGEVTMLLGRNGAGKTTTLRTIMGLWHASQGTRALQGPADRQPSGQLATPEIAQLRHRLRAREHGHLRRPDGAGEHGAGRARARAAPTRWTRSGWSGSSACSRR